MFWLVDLLGISSTTLNSCSLGENRWLDRKESPRSPAGTERELEPLGSPIPANPLGRKSWWMPQPQEKPWYQSSTSLNRRQLSMTYVGDKTSEIPVLTEVFHPVECSFGYFLVCGSRSSRQEKQQELELQWVKLSVPATRSCISKGSSAGINPSEMRHQPANFKACLAENGAQDSAAEESCWPQI